MGAIGAAWQKGARTDPEVRRCGERRDALTRTRIDRNVKPKLTEATMTPDGGVGTTWSLTARWSMIHIDATYTREEFAPNERIVDRNPDAPRGVVFSFEPDATGTTLTMAWLDSCRVPLLTRAWGRINWDGEHDIDAMLTGVKNAVET